MKKVLIVSAILILFLGMLAFLHIEQGRRGGRGEAQRVTVTVIPGMDVNSIARMLGRKGLPAREFLRISMPVTATSSGLEGYLYPDTYYFTNHSTADEIVGTMTRNFEEHFPAELFKAQKGKIRTREEVVIMASILEKEARTKEDKKMVAGILWKRLDEGLPLQVDSTAHYFLAVQNELLYNTYKSIGLPVAPICEPGLESLEAALEPAPSEYWYFLSGKNGQMIYSRTLSEHLINKAKYLE